MDVSFSINLPIVGETLDTDKPVGRSSKAVSPVGLDFASIVMLLCAEMGMPEENVQPAVVEDAKKQTELFLSGIEHSIQGNASEYIALNHDRYPMSPSFAEVSLPLFGAADMIEDPVDPDLETYLEPAGASSSLPFHEMIGAETVEKIALLHEEVLNPAYEDSSNQESSIPKVQLRSAPALGENAQNRAAETQASQKSLSVAEQVQVSEAKTDTAARDDAIDVKGTAFETRNHEEPDHFLREGDDKKTGPPASDAARGRNMVFELNDHLREPAEQVDHTSDAVHRSLPMRFEKLAEFLAEKANSRLPTSIELRLDPPSLGKMTVWLSAKGDEIVVKFVTSSYDAQQALMKSHDQLAQTLSEKGLSLAGFFTDLGTTNGERHHSRTFDDAIKNHRTGPTQVSLNTDVDETELAGHLSMGYGVFDYRV